MVCQCTLQNPCSARRLCFHHSHGKSIPRLGNMRLMQRNVTSFPVLCHRPVIRKIHDQIWYDISGRTTAVSLPRMEMIQLLILRWRCMSTRNSCLVTDNRFCNSSRDSLHDNTLDSNVIGRSPWFFTLRESPGSWCRSRVELGLVDFQG